MSNEHLIRCLIKGSLQRAIQESIAAIIVVIAFAAMMRTSEVGSLAFYGCVLILLAIGFIVGVVWSHALSYRLLRSHPASDVSFWRAAFHAQAKLLRWVPLWYCAPFCAGGILLTAPKYSYEWIPFLMVAGIFAIVFAGITWLNRRVAVRLENMSARLTAG